MTENKSKRKSLLKRLRLADLDSRIKTYTDEYESTYDSSSIDYSLNNKAIRDDLDYLIIKQEAESNFYAKKISEYERDVDRYSRRIRVLEAKIQFLEVKLNIEREE